MQNVNVLGVIPARYASTRFPGKPLADIAGKSMIRRVYERAAKSERICRLVVATDDSRIYDHVKSFTDDVYMTSSDHSNGTERIAEILAKDDFANDNYGIVVNIQGDEPFIDYRQIDEAVSVLVNCEDAEVGTLVKKENLKVAENANKVKVVVGNDGKALYFSRSVIPFNMEKDDSVMYNIHVGMYAYRTDVLKKIVEMRRGRLESLERLEQLRWLENGIKIYVKETNMSSYGVDVPEDIDECLKIYKENL